MGPIDVYLVSQFEEKFEDINAVEAPPNIPSTSGTNENATTTIETESRENEVGVQENATERMSSDVGTSHDFVSGIMKIVPDVDNEADYWLLSDAPDVSITDMWTECILY
nr:Transcription factor E2FB [Ipomoea batatas]